MRSPRPGTLRGKPTHWVEGEKEDRAHGRLGLRPLPGPEPEMYDQVIATLDLDANPPVGAILHLGARAGRAPCHRDLEDRADFQAFHDRFLQALRFRGYLDPPTVEVAPLHNVFAVRWRRSSGWGRSRCPPRSGCGALGAPHPPTSASAQRRDVPLDPARVRDRDHHAERHAQLDRFVRAGRSPPQTSVPRPRAHGRIRWNGSVARDRGPRL